MKMSRNEKILKYGYFAKKKKKEIKKLKRITFYYFGESRIFRRQIRGRIGAFLLLLQPRHGARENFSQKRALRKIKPFRFFSYSIGRIRLQNFTL